MTALVLSLAAVATLGSSLDKGLIKRVIRQHSGELQRCYERALVETPGAQGKVTVLFHVTGAGAVDEASVQTSTAGSAQLETCVVDAVKTWRFPAGVKAGFSIVYPFMFKPG